MRLDKKQKRDILRLALSACLTVAAFALLTLVSDKGTLVKIALFAPAFVLSAYPILAKAFSGIIRGQLFDENVLMSIACLCAMGLGECFEGVAIAFFAGIGEMFEHSAVEHVRNSVQSLASLCPDSATVIRDGAEISIPSSEIEVGDICLVRAGERIAVDGVIIEGSAGVDSSALTGESRPLDLFEGDEVSSGCIDLDGTLKIRATERAENSKAARIVALVEDSAIKKTRTEKFITRFSLRYTPCVVIAALLIAILLPVFGLAHWRSALYSALCFLVISCPCALVISVPLTFFGAIGGNAKKGVLFKTNSALEAMAKVKTVVLDKTGTLTSGSFKVSGVCPANDISVEQMLEIALALEKDSSHPISRAVTAYALNAGVSFAEDELCSIREYRGRGRVGVYKGKTVLAGNEKLLNEYGIIAPSELLDREGEGESLVYLAEGDRVIGLMTLWDSPKEDSAKALEGIRELGCRVVMLTGDSAESAERAARSLNIEEYKASLLPEDKVKYTEELMGECGKNESLAFVGDGINDAPALALAHVGVAMGGIGSDAAIECADVIIVSDSIAELPRAVKSAKKAVRIAKQNIVFALAVKFAVLILSAFGLCGMVAAVFADVGVSVIAILNAMRTLKD